LPIKAAAAALREAGLPAIVSNSAGTFVCNHLFYGLMHLAVTRRPGLRGGFLHVPYLPEQAAHHDGARRWRSVISPARSRSCSASPHHAGTTSPLPRVDQLMEPCAQRAITFVEARFGARTAEVRRWSRSTARRSSSPGHRRFGVRRGGGAARGWCGLSCDQHGGRGIAGLRAPQRFRVHITTGLDLADEAAVRRFYSGLPPLWRRFHLAGGFAMSPAAETSAVAFADQFQMNALSAFLCSAAALRAIRRAASPAPAAPKAAAS